MALINKATAAATETEVQETVETEVATPVEAPKTEAPGKAVAKKPTTAVAVSTEQSFLLTNPVIQEIVANAKSGETPTLVATSGTFKISGDKTDVGNIIDFYVLGTRRKFTCSPNDKAEDAKQYFAAAYDDDLTSEGQTIDECVEDAIAAGYTDAKKAEYIDVFVKVVANSKGDKIDLAGELMCLQLSFMSQKNWSSFANKLKMDASFGELDLSAGPPVVRATAFATSNRAGQDYTTWTFQVAPK